MDIYIEKVIILGFSASAVGEPSHGLTESHRKTGDHAAPHFPDIIMNLASLHLGENSLLVWILGAVPGGAEVAGGERDRCAGVDQCFGELYSSAANIAEHRGWTSIR